MFIVMNCWAGQTMTPKDLSWRVNSGKPVQGDHNAHGRFEGRDENRSVQTSAAQHIGWPRHIAAVVVITVAAVVATALATLFQGRRKGGWGELGKADNY